MRVRHLCTMAIVAGCGIGGCGKSTALAPAHPTLVADASTNIALISPRDVNAYMKYTLSFYAWENASRVPTALAACAAESSSAGCTSFRRQVVSRLVQERTVARYASRHHIELAVADKERVHRELVRLTESGSRTSTLFKQPGVSQALMKQVIENQFRVYRVEQAVVPRALLHGPSIRVRKFVFSRTQASYHQAVDLATGGAPAAHVQLHPMHWVATSRLTRKVRGVAALAVAGDYIGPFIVSRRYVVYEVLGHGDHVYGKPARQAIDTRFFRHWLSAHTSGSIALCESAIRKGVACTLTDH